MSEHIDSFKIKRYPSKQHENQVAVDSERKSIYFHFKVIESSFVKKSKHVVFLNLVLQNKEISSEIYIFTFLSIAHMTDSSPKKKWGKVATKTVVY